MSSPTRLVARAARVATLAAVPLAALVMAASPVSAADSPSPSGPIIGFPVDDPCAPVGPLCDPLPPCPVIAPGPLAVTVDLSFAPCDEPFATDSMASGAIAR